MSETFFVILNLLSEIIVMLMMSQHLLCTVRRGMANTVFELVTYFLIVSLIYSITGIIVK